MAKATKKTKVAIIILTINSPEMVVDTLESISKLKTDNLDLSCVVVDSSSDNLTRDRIKDYSFKNINYKYIQTFKNLGFAGGNNVGIKYALGSGPDYVLVLNDDMIVSGDLLKKLVTFMDLKNEVGIVSPKIYFAKGHEFHKNRYKESEKGKVIWYAGGLIDWDNIYTSHRGVDEADKGQYNREIETDIASGACMLIRSGVFKKTGYINDEYFLYWEDADFSRQVIKEGFKVYYYPKTHVWHKVSASAGGSGSSSNDYYLIRNRLYFALRYAKLRTKIAVLRDTVKLAFVGREWQKIGAKDALLGIKGIGSWKKK